MRTELYSVRSSTEEIAYINNNLKRLATDINEKASIKILFKTEIDCNAKKIKADLYESFEASNPPEFHIFANALDSKDISSFYSLFSPFIDSLEKDLRKQYEKKNIRMQSYPHIKIHSITDIGEYPAYCFSFKRRKFLVLPRISLTGEDFAEYVCKAVIAAKKKFNDTFDQCPDGYIFSIEKPTTAKNKLISVFKVGKHTGAAEPESQPEALEPPVPTATPEALESEVKEPEKSEDNPPADAPETNQKTKNQKKKKNANKSADTKNEPSMATPLPASIDIIEETADIAPETTSTEAIKEAPAENTEKAENAEEENTEEKTKNKKSGFKNFLKSFIPMKGDTKKSIILKIVVLVAIVAFFVGAFLLLKFYVIDPGVNKADIKEIQNIFYSTPEPYTVIEEYTDADGEVHTIVNTVNPDDGNQQRNWAGVQKINKEIVAWLKQDNTSIDYPVLYHKDDTAESQYYLYRNYKKKYSDFGSIFVDYRCTDGADSKHVILHGHNMGSDKEAMFGSFVNYPSNLDYYKSHAVFSFDTPKESGEWVVFAVMKLDVAAKKDNIFNYLQTEFTNDTQYMNFIYNIKERSYFNVDVPINEDDRILTLSTCSYETDTMRTIVVARKVRDGEDISEYVNGAKKQTPASTVSSDFSAELENIKWYDGKGDLNGDGTLQPMEKTETFTVKFYDAYGKVIRTETVRKGEDAVGITGAPPVKESDSKYHYRFEKWSTSYENVTKNLDVKPVYTKIPIPSVTTTSPEVPKTTPETSSQTTKPQATKPTVTNPTATTASADTPTPTTTASAVVSTTNELETNPTTASQTSEEPVDSTDTTQ